MPPNTKPLRHFIALRLDAQVNTALNQISGRLNSARWSRPEHFHITVGYLGSVAPELAMATFADVKQAVVPVPTLGLHGMGHFPNRPEAVVFNDVERKANLLALRQRVKAVMDERGFPPPAYPTFNPHITQATFEDLDNNADALADMLQRYGSFAFPDAPVTGLVLYASQRVEGRTLHTVCDQLTFDRP